MTAEEIEVHPTPPPKPCPFCGGPAYVEDVTARGFDGTIRFVGCKACQLSQGSSDLVGILTWWNYRPAARWPRPGPAPRSPMPMPDPDPTAAAYREGLRAGLVVGILAVLLVTALIVGLVP